MFHILIYNVYILMSGNGYHKIRQLITNLAIVFGLYLRFLSYPQIIHR